MYVIVKEGEEVIFERGNKEASHPIIKELKSGKYKLSVFLEKPQSNIKDIEIYLKSLFEQEPERVIDDFESVLIGYLKYSFSHYDRSPKAIRNSILNKLRNISGSGVAMILRPFIIIRSSVRDNMPKPYVSPSKISIIGFPIEEYIRYEVPYEYKEIDSSVVYLSTSDVLSVRFYKMFDELLRETYDYHDYNYEIVMKRGKKSATIESILIETLERLSSMFRGSDIDRIAWNRHSLRYKIVRGKIVPDVNINITLVQLPPSVDKRDVEKTAKEKIFNSIRQILCEILEIEDIEAYIDLSDVKISVNI